jgi:hypothetical protein
MSGEVFRETVTGGSDALGQVEYIVHGELGVGCLFPKKL